MWPNQRHSSKARETCVRSTKNSNSGVVSVQSYIRPRMVCTSISFIIPLVSATSVKKCDKAFMFFAQYQEYSNVHMDSVKNKYSCHKSGCDKYYGSTHAQNYHEQHHKVKTLKCTFQEKKGNPKCGVQGPMLLCSCQLHTP